MSGGSYNYMSIDAVDGSKPLGEFRDELAEMARSLAAQGYADEALKTLLALQHIEQADTIARELKGIWKAVEWTESGDWGPERIREAVCAYRRAKSGLVT